MRQAIRRSLGSLFLAATAGIPAGAVVTPEILPNLLYTAVPPCRIVDTRVGNAPLVAGETRFFYVAGQNDFDLQGGSTTGCNIPGTDPSFGGQTVQAVMLNLVAVGATGPGDLVAWPSDQPQPTASVLNYAASSRIAGLNIANGVILPLSQAPMVPTKDLSVVAQVSGTHLVIDILGYFSASSPSTVASTSNVYLGTAAGNPGDHGGVENVGVGLRALGTNLTGANSTAVGYNALAMNHGASGNVAIGSQTLQGADSSQNTFVGALAGASLTTGADNTVLGYNALSGLFTGGHNIAVGHDAGENYGTNEAGNIVIGSLGVSGESNTIHIGNGQSALFVSGIFGQTSSGGTEVFVNSNDQLGTVTSSRRFKEDIADMGRASDALYQLRPVTFHYKPGVDDGSHLLQYGLVAEEVAEVLPGLVQYDADGQPETVRYRFVNAMLLNEVQKQHTTIAAQETEITALQARLAALETRQDTVDSLARQLAEIRAGLARPH